MKTENVWATALVGVTILWGWSFVSIHEPLSTLSATAFNAFRFLVGGFAMLIILARKPRRIRFNELRDGALAGMALFVAFTFQTTGIAYTTASNASFITGLAVVFTPLFALVLLKAQPNRQQAFGAVVAAVGLGFCRGKAVESYKGDIMRIAYVTNE
jgi:drug/metabolite transporter (DMT)-like permease